MKRPIKPFVVEVKKGAKTKDPARDPAKPKIALKEVKPLAHELAERRLFQSHAPALAQAERPSGRILQSLDVPPPAPLLTEEPLPRRGRPPGSRNKAKLEAGPPPVPKKRGRPRKIPEGAVRQVPITPDLASALIARISAAPPPRPVLPPPPPPPAPASLSRLDQLIASARSGETLERVRAGERWKRRLRGAARSGFERRHAKV